MGEKGMYSSIIALIAVAIVSAMAFGMATGAQREEYKSSINELVYLKWEWQNAYHLLSESAADAVADSAFEGDGITDCDFEAALNSGAMQTKVSGYFRAVLQQSLKNCTVDGISVSKVGGTEEAEITFNLACSKDVEGMSIYYKKDARVFKKTVYTQGGGGSPCFVDVEDSTSNVCQVDTWAGGGCGN